MFLSHARLFFVAIASAAAYPDKLEQPDVATSSSSSSSDSNAAHATMAATGAAASAAGADASSSSAAVELDPDPLKALDAARKVIASGQPNSNKQLHAAICCLMKSLAFGNRTEEAIDKADFVANSVNDPVNCWRTQAWAAISADSFPKQFATDFIKLNELVTTAIRDYDLSNSKSNCEDPLLPKSIIAGNVVQTALNTSNDEHKMKEPVKRKMQVTKAIQDLFQQIVRTAVRRVAPDFLKVRAAHFTVTKMLVAEEGEGEQPLHWDSGRWQGDDDDESVISALYYPYSCDSALLPASFSAVDSFSQDMDQLTMMARARLLDKKYFRSIHLDDRGTLLLFRHCVPHAGAACNTSHVRAAVFGMLTRRLKGLAPEDQCFEWCYIASAFGNRSEEYYESLCKNQQHSPLERESPKERAATQEWMDRKEAEQD